ncbi:MAG: ribosome maturation factor RimP [Acidobacteriota bacterium]
MDAPWMERLRTLAQGTAALFGLELFDLESRLAGRRWWFRITLDRMDGAVTIEDCEKVSRHLSAQLDVEDLIPHAYELEVSSPGVERPLRELKDYDRFKGCKARLILGAGGPEAGQVLEGDLAGTEGEEVLLDMGNETRRVAVDRIKKAHLVFQFP